MGLYYTDNSSGTITKLDLSSSPSLCVVDNISAVDWSAACDRTMYVSKSYVDEMVTFKGTLSYLKPAEVKSLWEKIKVRCFDEEEKKKIIKEILANVKMSEKFVMDNIELVDIDWIKTYPMYSQLISSGEYKNLKLFIYS